MEPSDKENKFEQYGEECSGTQNHGEDTITKPDSLDSLTSDNNVSGNESAERNEKIGQNTESQMTNREIEIEINDEERERVDSVAEGEVHFELPQNQIVDVKAESNTQQITEELEEPNENNDSEIKCTNNNLVSTLSEVNRDNKAASVITTLESNRFDQVCVLTYDENSCVDEVQDAIKNQILKPETEASVLDNDTSYVYDNQFKVQCRTIFRPRKRLRHEITSESLNYYYEDINPTILPLQESTLVSQNESDDHLIDNQLIINNNFDEIINGFERLEFDNIIIDENIYDQYNNFHDDLGNYGAIEANVGIGPAIVDNHLHVNNNVNVEDNGAIANFPNQVQELFEDDDASTQVTTITYQVAYWVAVVQDNSKIFKDLEKYHKWSFKEKNMSEDTDKRDFIEKTSFISDIKRKISKLLKFLNNNAPNNKVCEDAEILLEDLTSVVDFTFLKHHLVDLILSYYGLNIVFYYNIIASLDRSLLFLKHEVEKSNFLSSKQRLLQDNAQSFIHNQPKNFENCHNQNLLVHAN